LVTLAPELDPPGMIELLRERGVTVAAGHTAASYEDTRDALRSGVAGFTHLFNAMTQLGGRDPGAVGAALESEQAWCGIIADGFHVHPASPRVALRAKGPDKIVLVTDAMPTVGSDQTTFILGGRTIHVENGRIAAEDGTLAGSNLNMAAAVANAIRMLEIDLAAAVRMASLNPARALGIEETTGEIRRELRADLALLDSGGRVVRTWIAGVPN
jgi:N-acetylglucosamine-6-phosphate deacetylase